MNTNQKLSDAQYNEKLKIVKISTDNQELNDFLFSLGCYEGESIVLVSKLSGGYVVTIKDARYNIDRELADCIIVAQ